MDYKDRVFKALQKNHARLYKEQKRETKSRRKNQKPEKELEVEVLSWLSLHGFDAHVVEAKAVFHAKTQQYLKGQAEAGFPDICGCSSFGDSVWIELKAPGRLGTFRENQRSFITSKIEKNCFAVCIDSVEKLQQYWDQWRSMKDCQSDPKKMRDYLFSVMPRRPKSRSEAKRLECLDTSFLE